MTFTCRGNGEIVWIVGGIQIRSPLRVAAVAEEGIFVEVGRRNFSQLVMTASVNLNTSVLRFIVCRVETGDIITESDSVDSEEVSLFVFGELIIQINVFIRDSINFVVYSPQDDQ